MKITVRIIHFILKIKINNNTAHFTYTNCSSNTNINSYKICDTLWFEGNLKDLIHDSVEFVRTFQNVFNSAVWS